MNNELLFKVGDVLQACRFAIKTPARNREEAHCLKRGSILRVERKHQFKRIEVRSGAVWLTGTPARGDVLLRAGEIYNMHGAWPYIAEVIETAEVSLA